MLGRTSIVGLLAATVAVAQTLAPSPTESVGCVPHDDHWLVERGRMIR